MIRKFLLVGALCAALASCGQPPAPCPTPAPAPQSPVGDQSMILGGAAIVQVKGGFGGRSSFSRSYSRPSYSKPSYSPSYKRSTTTNNHTTIIQQNSGGGSNGLLWGLGGYFLGQHAANASKCQ